MPRIPYKPGDTDTPPELVAAIRARRGGKLLHLDRMLLYSPPFARGWNALLGAVRTELSLPPRLRELAICVVAIVNDAPYELHHHAPELLRAGGTDAQLQALQHLAVGDAAHVATALFDPAERAVVQLARRLTREARVSDAELAALRAVLPDDHVVELIGVIGAYNMVSRFLVALDIQAED